MSATVIRLRDEPTPAQLQRVRDWCESQLSAPVCTADRSLLEDLARLVGKIDAATFLMTGARAQSKSDSEASASSLLHHAFSQLYRDAEKIMMRALNDYPSTQMLGRRRRGSRTRRKRNKQMRESRFG